MTTDRFRLRFTFWLDVNKPEEHELAEQIEELKQKRSFVKTVRQGIRLILSLRENRTDVLQELFPEVVEALSGPRNNAEAKTYEVLQAQLDRLEQHLLQNNTPDKARAGLKPLPGAIGPGTRYEDDGETPELVVKKAEDNGEQSVQNFLNSLMALGG